MRSGRGSGGQGPGARVKGQGDGCAQAEAAVAKVQGPGSRVKGTSALRPYAICIHNIHIGFWPEMRIASGDGGEAEVWSAE